MVVKGLLGGEINRDPFREIDIIEINYTLEPENFQEAPVFTDGVDDGTPEKIFRVPFLHYQAFFIQEEKSVLKLAGNRMAKIIDN
jgi:hypothetical protein